MNIRLPFRWLAAIACIGITATAIGVFKLTRPGLANSSTIFQSIRPALERSGIPLRLPSYIPAPSASAPPIYASAPQPQPERGYLAILGYTPDCNGENVCRLGFVSSSPKPSNSIEEDYQRRLGDQGQGLFHKHQSAESFTQVALDKGITGYFIPWLCTNVCTDAEVVWDESFYRYSVGIKLGDKASLIKMANSAIEASCNDIGNK